MLDLHAEAHPLAEVSFMQRLQHLAVDYSCCPHMEALLPHLPVSLTSLHMKGTEFTPETQFMPDTSDISAATRLTNLQALQLEGLEFDPRVMASWPQLRRLCQIRVHLGVLPDTESEPDSEFNEEWAAAYNCDEVEDDYAVSLKALLSAVDGFVRLEELTLTETVTFDVERSHVLHVLCPAA